MARKFFSHAKIEKFVIEELNRALNGLKRGKSQDSSGICAEMLKDAPEELWTSILEVFFNLLCSFRTKKTDQWSLKKIG